MAKKHSIRETLHPLFALVLGSKKIADKALSSKLNITMAQFRILAAVKRDPNLSQRSIAEFWGVTEASASRQINILTKKGLISRTHDSNNRRKYVLKLTKKGQREIKQASHLINESFEKIFKEISNKDREIFHNLLQRFIMVVKKTDPTFGAGYINKHKK
jgi:DNA-binding MarR family transcriptional regulator